MAVFDHTLNSEGRPTPPFAFDQDFENVSGAAEPSNQFGASLAMVPYCPAGAAGATEPILVVGAPGEDLTVDGVDKADAGSVLTFGIPASGTFRQLHRYAQGTGTDDVAVTNGVRGRFGSTVTAVNTAPRALSPPETMKLAIGVPDEKADQALAAPTFKVPFPCGQVWPGRTWDQHSPVNAIDFNLAGTADLGKPVVASAPGSVERVTDTGSTSYGKYVVINHGGGYTTYYAHLRRWSVSVGQRVGYGIVIGEVGDTGGAQGAHLHYEQRFNGDDVKVRFNGVQARYWGTQNYRSDNNCAGPRTYTGTVNTTGAPLRVRSGPGTGYSVVGSVAGGATVTISCQTTGTRVSGTYGTSSIWDRIGAGRFIADAYVRTGYDGFIPGAPRCP